MTRVLLLPRLNELGVMRIIDDVGSEMPTVKEVLDILDEHSSFLWFAPSGDRSVPNPLSILPATSGRSRKGTGFRKARTRSRALHSTRR